MGLSVVAQRFKQSAATAHVQYLETLNYSGSDQCR